MNISELRESARGEYKYKIEMHAHTSPASGCSEILPKKMVEIYSDLGYDAVVLTNHFIFDQNIFENHLVDKKIELFIKDFEDTKKAAENTNLKVILGAEIRFTENINDYLIYGVTKKMLKNIYNLLPYGVQNFRKNFDMQDSIFIQAHPFRDGCEVISPELLDGIETLNLHPGHNSRISLATKFADENKIRIVTAGSDFHHLNRNHEGSAALLSKVLPNDGFELAKILRSKDYLLEIGGRSIVLP